VLTYGRFARYTLIVLALVAALLLLWELSRVLLLGFGAVLFAIIFRAGGGALARRLPISSTVGTVFVLVAVTTGVVALGMLAGDEAIKQVGELRERIPEALDRARAVLSKIDAGRTALRSIDGAMREGVSASVAMRAASTTFGVLTDLVLVALIAVYLSLSPRSYFQSTIALAPARFRERTRSALLASGKSLRGWLLGQLVAMTSVGILTGVGLWLVGVPNALILGILAGLLEFVPILGPFIAAIPGVLLAFVVGPTTALYAILVYLVVQQLESGVITPLAQRWAVDLPPALALLAVVVFGVLFGLPGILFATPITVVLMVLTRRFYLCPQDELEAEMLKQSMERSAARTGSPLPGAVQSHD
jgi:predicted PurR-regulated permease PerM